METNQQKMKEEHKNEIENIIDYKFIDAQLLHQAYMHRSYANENLHLPYNKALETIGDAVIQYFVTIDIIEWHKKECEKNPWRVGELTKGKLTEIRKDIVKNCYLAGQADTLGLAKDEYIKFGNKKPKEIGEEKLRAGLLECVIGAVALDSKHDFGKLQIVVTKLLDAKNALRDYFNSRFEC